MIRRVLFVAAAIVTSTTLVAEPVSADPISAEQTFVSRINSVRSAYGVRPLHVDPTLTSVARDWAYKMALDGHISHRRDLSIGAPQTWMFLGENVGQGWEAHSLHDAFAASQTHLANLVHPRFDSVGVGVVMVGSTMFVAQEFMQSGYPVVTKAKKLRKCQTRRCRRARARYRASLA